jgi:hypothetical protein
MYLDVGGGSVVHLDIGDTIGVVGMYVGGVSSANTSTWLNSKGNMWMTMGAASDLFFFWKGSTGTKYRGTVPGTGIDLAEWYPVSPQFIDTNGVSTIKKATLVCTDTSNNDNTSRVQPCTESNSKNIVGIVSTNPWSTMGTSVLGKTNNVEDDINYDGGVEVALVGRVPVIVNSLTPIKSGDMITSSTTSGIAQKTTQAGPTVGKVMESSNWNDQRCPAVSSIESINWPIESDETDEINVNSPCYKLPDGSYIGKLVTFVNVSWYDSDINLTATGEVNVNYNISPEVLSSLGYDGTKNEIESATYSLTDSLGNTINRIGQFTEIASAKIKAGLISATNIVTKNLIAEKINTKELVSPKANIDEFSAKTATISGTLIASDIQTTSIITDTLISKEATISTLYADNIISKEGSFGELMTEKVSALREEIKKLISTNVATPSTTLTGTSIMSQASSWSMDIASDSAKITGDLELTNNLIVGAKLMVSGDTQLGNAFVTGTFTTGEIAIKDNLIETTNSALYIQPSQTGSVHIMGDTLVIAENGEVEITGNLKVSGSLMANLITADEIQTQKLTSVEIGSSNLTSTEITSDRIKIATDSAQTIIAESGFAAIATSSSQLTSNATAGTATLPAGKTEIIISNNKITPESMIYLTPVGSTRNQVPYIKSKIVSETESYFTVAIDQHLTDDVIINWWIIN